MFPTQSPTSAPNQTVTLVGLPPEDANGYLVPEDSQALPPMSSSSRSYLVPPPGYYQLPPASPDPSARGLSNIVDPARDSQLPETLASSTTESRSVSEIVQRLRNDLGQQSNESKRLGMVTFMAAPKDQVSATTTERPAMDLICVVDKSGSMSGEKIAQVKRSISSIIDVGFFHCFAFVPRLANYPPWTQFMDARDRLGIVLFDDATYIQNYLTIATDENKTLLRRSNSLLNAGGGTNIADGLSLALDILEARTQTNATTGVLLLSDGQDTFSFGDEHYKTLSQRVERLSYPVFTFGIGRDHDARCLENLARNGGVFTFINTTSDLQRAFQTAVSTLKAVSMKNIRLTVTLPTDCRLGRVFSGYPVENLDGNRFVVRFPEITYGEKRNIVFEAENLSDLSDFCSCLVFQDALSGQEHVFASKVALTGVPEVTLHVERLRIVAAEAIQRALNFAQKENDTARARQILQQVKTDIESVLARHGTSEYLSSLLVDIEGFRRSMGHLSSEVEATMRHVSQANSQQRAMPSQSSSQTVRAIAQSSSAHLS